MNSSVNNLAAQMDPLLVKSYGGPEAYNALVAAGDLDIPAESRRITFLDSVRIGSISAVGYALYEMEALSNTAHDGHTLTERGLALGGMVAFAVSVAVGAGLAIATHLEMGDIHARQQG